MPVSGAHGMLCRSLAKATKVNFGRGALEELSQRHPMMGSLVYFFKI